MSEEVVQQDQTQEVVDQQSEQQPQLSDVEQQALEQGWRPQEEWEGDPDKWRPAKEFVERGELFGKIDHMGRELKETKKALRMLQDHHTKVKETEFQRAVQELKALQKQHLESGDSDGYLETTELLTDLKAEQKARQVMEQTAPKGPDPRFLSWVDTNKWYAQDPEMREFADGIGLKHARDNPDKDPSEVLTYVVAQVKRAFPDSFKNQNRERPSPVEGSTTRRAVKSDSFALTDDEKRVMNTFVRQGVMTKDEYISEIKRMRG